VCLLVEDVLIAQDSQDVYQDTIVWLLIKVPSSVLVVFIENLEDGIKDLL